MLHITVTTANAMQLEPSCLLLETQPFQHSHSNTAIPTQPFQHSHSNTAILTQPFQHSHSNTAIPTQHRITKEMLVIAAVFEQQLTEREREMFYLTMHSTHFIYGYMASDILRTILIVRKETCCRHVGNSY